MGAWIETGEYLKQKRYRWSHPIWVRGLKRTTNKQSC